MIIKDQSSATWNYYETTTDDGASSSRVSHLQPDDNDAQRPPSPPRHAHTIHSTPSPARRRLGLTALASTVFVVAMSAGLATFFLLYIILSQVPHVSDPTAFVVRERVVASSMVEASSLSALTVSTAISHFLSITTPIVFSLLAYRTAYLWMQAQSSPRVDEEGRLPTPLHYGLLVRILNSSSILNLGPLLGYFLPRLGRRPNPANTVPITTPRLLREAFGAAFIIYILSHAVGLADIWLHAASSVAIAESVTPAKILPEFSMVFNTSLCDPSTGAACMRYKDHWGQPDVTRTASLVAANSTVPTEISVVTLADANDTAILVPTGFVREWNFSASTYGARAKCYEVGLYCAEGGCPAGSMPGPAIAAGMSIDALQVPKLDSKSQKVFQRAPTYHDYRDLSRVMAYVGNVTVGSPTGVPASVANAVPPNPGPVLIKLRWTDFQTSRATTGSDDTSEIISSGTAQDGNDEFQSRIITTLYTQCSLEFVKVRYGYNQNYAFVAHDIQKMTGEEADIASIFWSPLIWQHITPQLESNVHQECFGDYTAKGLLAMLRQELSRLAIAGASGVLMRSNETVSDASTVVQVLVGRYPHTPVFVFAGALYAYAAFAVILFLATTACASDVIIPSDPDGTKEKAYIQGAKPPRSYTALELAQRRLVDPATLVAEQYVWASHTTPTRASEMSTRTRTAEMFGVNQPVHEGKAAMGPERLVVGMGGPYADTGNPRFGVWRRPKRQVDPEPEMQAGYGLAAQSSIGSGDVELTEGTTLVGSTMRYHRDSDTGRLGLPPTYASLSRGTRSRSEGSDLRPEYLVRHGPGTGLVDTRQPESIRVDLGPQGRRRVAPEKDLTELMQIRSSVSSEGSVASTSTERTIRRSTGI